MDAGKGKYRIPSLLDTRHVARLNSAATKFFINAVGTEVSIGYGEFTEQTAKNTGVVGLLFWKRLNDYGGAKVCIGAALTLLFSAQGNPQNVVLCAFAIARLYATIKKPIGMRELVDAFPLGFPDAKGYEEVWDGQKGVFWGESVENLTDHPELLVS